MMHVESSDSMKSMHGTFDSDPLHHGPFKQIDPKLKERGLCEVQRASFHPVDPVVLACGLADGRVVLLRESSLSDSLIWETEHQFLVGDRIVSLGWNLDGSQIAAGCSNGTVVVWRYPCGQLYFTFERKYPLLSPRIAWNPFNRDMLAIFAQWNRCARILISAPTVPLIHEFKSTSDIKNVEWIDKNELACGCRSGEVLVYQFDGQQSTKITNKFDNGNNYLAWNERLKLLATGSWVNSIKVWSMERNDPVYNLNIDSASMCLSWLPHEKQGQHLNLINTASNRPQANASLLAGGLADGSVVMWTPLENCNQAPRYLKGHSSFVKHVAFSPCGRFLASDGHNEIIVWSTETSQNIYSMPPTNSVDLEVTWNATGCKLAVYDEHGTKELQILEYVGGNK